MSYEYGGFIKAVVASLVLMYAQLCVEALVATAEDGDMTLHAYLMFQVSCCCLGLFAIGTDTAFQNLRAAASLGGFGFAVSAVWSIVHSFSIGKHVGSELLPAFFIIASPGTLGNCIIMVPVQAFIVVILGGFYATVAVLAGMILYGGFCFFSECMKTPPPLVNEIA